MTALNNTWIWPKQTRSTVVGLCRWSRHQSSPFCVSLLLREQNDNDVRFSERWRHLLLLRTRTEHMWTSDPPEEPDHCWTAQKTGARVDWKPDCVDEEPARLSGWQTHWFGLSVAMTSRGHGELMTHFNQQSCQWFPRTPPVPSQMSQISSVLTNLSVYMNLSSVAMAPEFLLILQGQHLEEPLNNICSDFNQSAWLTR